MMHDNLYKYPVTYRSLEMVQSYYKKLLNPHKLQGKRILDIGSGLSSMTQELRAHGIEAYSIDAKNVIPPNTSSHIRAFAQCLPFKDNCMDVIYSTWSLFSYREHPEILAKTVKEIHRVLKPAGRFFTSPVDDLQTFIAIQDSNMPFKVKKFIFNPNFTDLCAIVLKKPK